MPELSLSHCKCPRCRKLLRIAFDEIDVKNMVFSGYCYDESHKRLKIKFSDRLRMQKNEIHDEKYSMADLRCILCGGKMWFNKFKSFVTGNRNAYDCPVCKIGLEYQGKLVKDCPTYDEIIRVKVGKSRYYN